MINLVAILAVFVWNVSFADVLVIDGDDRRYLIYEVEGDAGVKIRLAACENFSAFPSRQQCSRSKEISKADFVSNLNAVFGIPAGYSDDGAIARLSLQIDSLKSEMEEIDGLSSARANNIRRRLLRLIVTQRIIIRLQESLTSKFTEGTQATIDPNSVIDPVRDGTDQLVIAAFDPTWADSSGRVWRLASIAAGFYAQTKLCRTPFRTVVPSDLENGVELRALSVSRVGQLVIKNGGVIWTDSKESVRVDPVTADNNKTFPYTERGSGVEHSATAINLTTREIVRPRNREVLVPGTNQFQRLCSFRRTVKSL